MKAIVKAKPAPGVELMDMPEPQLKPGHVKIKVHFGSVCGTDFHIYAWDPWAESRIHPPRIIGHEFSGIVEEIGEGVTALRPGDRVAGESHIVDWTCKQCRAGQAHVCINTKILGVDVDGGFASYAVIPSDNARKVNLAISLDVACVQDALGNAVHTAFAGPVEGQDILITGMGPIGLFAVGVCKAAGAKSVAVTEISKYRCNLAQKMGADLILNPTKDDVASALCKRYPLGVDATLEMSGHPSSLELAIQATRPGGRISLLGLFHERVVGVNLNDAIFKGIDIQGIVGRKLWETWDQMGELLSIGKLDITPVITHRFPYTQFNEAMELITEGQTGKVVFDFRPV